MPQPVGRSAGDKASTDSSSPGRTPQAADETAKKLVEADASKGAGAGAHGAETTGAQAEADRRYEEAIEDEYAKRDGGA